MGDFRAIQVWCICGVGRSIELESVSVYNQPSAHGPGGGGYGNHSASECVCLLPHAASYIPPGPLEVSEQYHKVPYVYVLLGFR
jgi:hypothetical protein